MTTLENRQKIYQQIDQLLPDQLYLLAEFLDFLHFKGNESATPFQPPSKRKAGLNIPVPLSSMKILTILYPTVSG